MAGSWDGSTASYLSIADDSDLSWPSAGWTWCCTFFYDTSQTEQSFQYLYSHAQPLNDEDAFNVIIVSTGGGNHGIRFILDWSIFTEADFTSSNDLVDDEWNSIMITYDGTDIHMWLNGTLTTDSPSALATINPSGSARIGYAVHGGSRVMRGRICHMAKWDRFFQDAEADSITTRPLHPSPVFWQNSRVWHTEIFDANNFFDMYGNVSISATSMSYGDHAPMAYPAMPIPPPSAGAPPPPTGKRRAYYVAA
jgi:hypothetical protein